MLVLKVGSEKVKGGRAVADNVDDLATNAQATRLTLYVKQISRPFDSQ